MKINFKFEYRVTTCFQWSFIQVGAINRFSKKKIFADNCTNWNVAAIEANFTTFASLIILRSKMPLNNEVKNND